MNHCRVIDLNTCPRRAHFEHFRQMAYPYVGCTVNVDITDFLAAVKAKGHPFFLSFLRCAALAANDVPQLRQRIANDEIVEFDFCPTSHTVAREDGTYSYCELDARTPDFLAYAAARQRQAKESCHIEDADPLPLIFVSTLPWFSYTSLIQPTPYPADSNPRLTWGRYFERDSRTLMPVTLLCNHALVDGLHLGLFYDRLTERLRQTQAEAKTV